MVEASQQDGRGKQISEFEVSLVYKARANRETLILKAKQNKKPNQTNKKTNNKKL